MQISDNHFNEKKNTDVICSSTQIYNTKLVHLCMKFDMMNYCSPSANSAHYLGLARGSAFMLHVHQQISSRQYFCG